MSGSGWKIYQPNTMPCLARTYEAIQELCDAVADREDRLDQLGLNRLNSGDNPYRYFRKSAALSRKNEYSYSIDHVGLSYLFIMPDVAEEILRQTDGLPVRYVCYVGHRHDDSPYRHKTIRNELEKYCNDRGFPNDRKLFTNISNRGYCNDARLLSAYYRLINDMIYYGLREEFEVPLLAMTWKNTGKLLSSAYGTSPGSFDYNFVVSRQEGKACHVGAWDDIRDQYVYFGSIEADTSGGDSGPGYDNTVNAAMSMFRSGVGSVSESSYLSDRARGVNSIEETTEYGPRQSYRVVRSSLESVSFYDDRFSISDFYGLQYTVLVGDVNGDWTRIQHWTSFLPEIPEINDILPPEKESDNSTYRWGPYQNRYDDYHNPYRVWCYDIPRKLDTPYYHEQVNAPRPTSP